MSDEPEPMSARRALALGVMACEHVAADARTGGALRDRRDRGIV